MGPCVARPNDVCVMACDNLQAAWEGVDELWHPLPALFRSLATASDGSGLGAPMPTCAIDALPDGVLEHIFSCLRPGRRKNQYSVCVGVMAWPGKGEGGRRFGSPPSSARASSTQHTTPTRIGSPAAAACVGDGGASPSRSTFPAPGSLAPCSATPASSTSWYDGWEG